MKPDVQIRIEAIGDADSVIDDWRDLVARTAGSYFQLPDWILAWWSTDGGRPPTTLAAWTGSEGLEAIAVTSEVRERLHPRLPFGVRTIVNTGSGRGAADHLGFPSLPHRRSDVGEWLAASGRTTMRLSNLSPDQLDRLPARAIVSDEVRCPRLAIGEGATFGRSASYRRQVRVKIRRAGDAGVTFRYVPPTAFSVDVLDDLIRLHELRWSERDATSAFDRSKLELHRHLVPTAAEGRGPAAVVAEGPGGDTVAVVYGVVHGATFAFFQSGWDPAWSDLGLGTVTHAVAFDLLAEAGCTVYDFLRGDEEYKYRFGAADMVDTSMVVPNGIGGRLLGLKSTLQRHRAGT